MCRDCEDEKMDEMTKAAQPFPDRILSVLGVAVEPPKIQGVTKKKIGGMEVPEVKSGLQELKVIYDGTFTRPGGQQLYTCKGMKVFVSSQALMAFPWAKEIYDIDGQPFIVVPPEYVVALKV